MMIVVRRDVKFDEDKAMRVSFERELELHADEEILAPKVEDPHLVLSTLGYIATSLVWAS